MKKQLTARINQIPGSIWIKIAKIDEKKGQWTGNTKLHPQILGRLKRSVLVTSTGASTRIEGAKLSDEDIEKLMRGIAIQNFDDRDKQEAQGYFELLENVFNSYQTLKLSEGLIKSFHKELLKYVQKDKLHRGDYKKRENNVMMINQASESVGVLFDTTPAWLTPKEMQELLEWTKAAQEEAQTNPILWIGSFVVQFLQIHPFQDGNGRISRILTNMLLLQAGYTYIPYISHEKIVEDNKAEYYMALQKSQKTFKTEEETILPWLEFFTDVLLKQASDAIELFSEESNEKFLSPSQQKVWEYIQTQNEVTPRELFYSLEIPRPTINQVLNRLISLDMIERFGEGRATRYRQRK